VTPLRSLDKPFFKIEGISFKFQGAPLSNKDPGASAPYKGDENFIVFQNFFLFFKILIN
jgi:hypothetical protein